MTGDTGFHKWRWRVIALWVVCFSMLVGYAINDIGNLATHTEAALCTFRDDLQARHDQGVQFIKDNPVAEPIPGLTRTALLANLKNQQRTLDSLAGLECA